MARTPERLHLMGGLAAAMLVPLLALGVSTALAAPSQPTQPAKPVVPKECKELTPNTRAYRTCVKKYSALFDDESLYAAGLGLAKDDQDYAGALTVLGAVRNADDTRVLTMIGYALRKSGRVDEAFDYYGRALKIDANNVQTREYLGEAFLQKGDLAGAKAQLTEISARCGISCESYVELDTQIKAFEGQSL